MRTRNATSCERQNDTDCEAVCSDEDEEDEEMLWLGTWDPQVITRGPCVVISS